MPQSVEEIVIPYPEKEARVRRAEGCSRSGSVDLRAFDEGIVRTMGAKVINDNYYLTIDNVSAPPGMPGIPVTFAYPEDVYEKNFLSTVVVRRDDVSGAMQRWHPQSVSYNAPPPSAIPIIVSVPGKGDITSWDRTEVKRQPEPVDIMYTISILSRHRHGIAGGNTARREANEILRYILSRYNVYSALEVEDDIGDLRTYDCYREGISMLDDLPDVAARVIGFAISLRVEGELDLKQPEQYKTVTTVPGFGSTGTIIVTQKVN